MNVKSPSLCLLLALLVVPTLASAQQSQSMPMLQTFDQGIPADWEFSCNRSLIASVAGNAMRIWGGGHAILPVTPQDFILGFRFRSAGGSGDIGFNFTDHSNSIDTLGLEPQRIMLSRRTQIQPGQFQHQDFASAYANFRDGLWHDLVVQYKNGRVDVWVDRVPVIGYQYTSRLPQGVVGLGVILNSGSVDYDNVSYGPAQGAMTPPVATTVPGTTITPPGTAAQPGQLMVTQPPPGGAQPVTGAAQTDFAVTDVYATQLRNGQLFAAVTNRGPLSVTQQPVELQLNIDGALSYFKSNVTLPAGQTTTLNVGSINTASASSSVQVRLTATGLPDPNPGNNLYSEVLPQAPSPGNRATDLVLSDIWSTKKIQGQVGVEVTNRGPVDATGPVELMIVVNGQQRPLEQYVVALKPNETRRIYTNVVIDASQGDQTITATVRRPGIHDLSQANNTTQETVTQVGTGGQTLRDLAIKNIHLQGSTAPVGWQSLRVLVANDGTLTVIGDARLSFSVNNGPYTTVTEKLALPPGESVVISTGHIVYDNQLPVTVQANLEMPGFADTRLDNNSFTQQLVQ